MWAHTTGTSINCFWQRASATHNLTPVPKKKHCTGFFIWQLIELKPECTIKAEVRQKLQTETADGACVAIFWPTPSFKGSIFKTSGFSTVAVNFCVHRDSTPTALSSLLMILLVSDPNLSTSGSSIRVVTGQIARPIHNLVTSLAHSSVTSGSSLLQFLIQNNEADHSNSPGSCY